MRALIKKTCLIYLALIVSFMTFDLSGGHFANTAKAANNPDDWSSVYDPEYYESHSEGAHAYANGDKELLWNYFVKVGIPNKEQGSEEFNVDIYMQNYPELVKQYGTNYVQYYVHYQQIGKTKGYNGKTLKDGSKAVELDENEYLYPEGYIIVGEKNAKKLENAALSLRTKDGNKIAGFESVVYETVPGSANGNLFFVTTDNGKGTEYIYSDGLGQKGVGTSKVQSIIDGNSSIKHWNIIVMYGENGDASNVQSYINSYSNWVNKDFTDANVYFVAQTKTNTAFNGRIKTTFSKKYIDLSLDYSKLSTEDYEKALVDVLTKARQLRVSSYEPNEVGFLIMSECHSDILLWSIPQFMEDKSIVPVVPKENIVPMSSKSHGYPNYFAGGVTVNYEGLDYEADSIVNQLMKEHKNVKFWYIVYFAGSNYVRNIGAKKAAGYAESNLDTIANKVYYADNTIALMTTPPMYNRGKSAEKMIDSYDDLELEFMESMGYSDYAYDTREDFCEYVKGKTLKRVEFPGFKYASSGDGLHFYGKQYWTVTVNAVNAIYEQSRGE